jgi:uncharacterized membrane protein
LRTQEAFFKVERRDEAARNRRGNDEEETIMAASANVIDKWKAVRIRHHHRHPAVRNVNQIAAEEFTVGQRAADSFAAMLGSWTFIMIQSVVLAAWLALNVVAWMRHWDPYPFILLNLALSFQAAYSAPIIMMSQNRQAMKDRIAAEHDYEINVKAEDELKAVMAHLEQQDEMMIDILHRLEQQHQDMMATMRTLIGARPQP